MRTLACVLILISGCTANKAVITGHDFIDEAVAALGTGISE